MRKQRSIIFDVTERNLTPGYLALVTMDYVLARAPSQNKRLQAELLNMGFLQTLVAKSELRFFGGLQKVIFKVNISNGL